MVSPVHSVGYIYFANYTFYDVRKGCEWDSLGFVQVTHSAVVTGIASFIGCMQEKGLLKLLMNRIEFCIVELILTTKAQYLEHSSSV